MIKKLGYQIKGYHKICGVVTPLTELVVSESYNKSVVNL